MRLPNTSRSAPRRSPSRWSRIGAAEATLKLVRIVAHPRSTHGERKALWRRFGVWLLLALEFELAADIVRSVITPTWEEIGALGAIAVIRTFLNYFLEQDLEHSAEPDQRAEAYAEALRHPPDVTRSSRRRPSLSSPSGALR